MALSLQEIIPTAKAIVGGNFSENTANQNPDRLRFITPNATLGQVIGNVVNWILIFAGFLAVIYLVYAGILYITAGGDTEKAGNARQGIIHAVIGIIVILLALAIVRWVMNIVTNAQT